jgi:DNA-damage-inducible protein J
MKPEVRDMAHKTSVNIRMDEDLKRQANELFASLSMDLSTAVNIFVRQAVDLGGLPFEVVKRDPFYSVANQAALQRSLDQYKAGKVQVHDLIDVDG